MENYFHPIEKPSRVISFSVMKQYQLPTQTPYCATFELTVSGGDTTVGVQREQPSYDAGPNRCDREGLRVTNARAVRRSAGVGCPLRSLFQAGVFRLTTRT